MNLLLVDDHSLVRKGLKMSLEDIDLIDSISECTNGAEAVDFVKMNSVDLILMDIRMPLMDGITATRNIHRDNPDAKIIALTMHDEEFYLKQMFDAGARGYLLKNSDKDKLLEAIEMVYNGYKYIDNQINTTIS